MIDPADEEIRDIAGAPAAPAPPSMPSGAQPAPLPGRSEAPPGAWMGLGLWGAEWGVGLLALILPALSALAWAASAPGAIRDSAWSLLLSLSNSGQEAMIPLSGAFLIAAPLWLFARPMRSEAPLSSRRAKLSCLAWAALGGGACQWLGICALDLRQGAFSAHAWLGLAALPPLAWLCFSRMARSLRRLRSAEPSGAGIFPGGGRASALFGALFIAWCCAAELDDPAHVWQAPRDAAAQAVDDALGMAEQDLAERRERDRADELDWKAQSSPARPPSPGAPDARPKSKAGGEPKARK